jgi:hypothetical protein
MTQLSKLWVGDLYGTNTGNLFVEFDFAGDRLTGVVRLMDDGQRLAIYSIRGTFDGSRMHFEGGPTRTVEGFAYGQITATATLNPEGQLRGRWESSIGTAGTFVLVPHGEDGAVTAAQPRGLHTVTRKLGVIRLGKAEIQDLISMDSRS